jgi:hypothetical protein
LSPRRVWALTRLTFQEAFRRRVWIALVLFLVVLAISAWYLQSAGGDRARLYISWVLGVSTFLVWVVVLFLSAISLPLDIARKTIYTVVTKPVRASEIILGRLLGVSLVGTGLLGVMGLINYIFVTRGLNHGHQVESLTAVTGTEGVLEGRTTIDMGHRHKVTVDPRTPVTLPALEGGVLAGRVATIAVSPGDEVRPGQRLLDVTANMLRIPVYAPFAGRISSVVVKVDDDVRLGATLLTLDRGETDVVQGHWHELIPERLRFAAERSDVLGLVADQTLALDGTRAARFTMASTVRTEGRLVAVEDCHIETADDAPPVLRTPAGQSLSLAEMPLVDLASATELARSTAGRIAQLPDGRIVVELLDGRTFGFEDSRQVDLAIRPVARLSGDEILELKDGLAVSAREGRIVADTEEGQELSLADGQVVRLEDGRILELEGGQVWQKAYAVGPPRDLLVARVPVYGQLRFRDRDGAHAMEGINVGDQWTYRQYIEGGTLAAAVWHFQGLTPEKFPDGLKLNMTLGVFRTHKGEIEKGIPGSLVLRNPKTQREYEAAIFTPTEFSVFQLVVDRYPVAKGESLDLFQDLVADGNLEVQIRCLPAGQYFGMAQADLYLLAGQASFWRNFIKAYIGIWLQMVLIAAFGVMSSSFLNAAVSSLATFAEVVAGLFVVFIQDVATGKIPGGGPLESFRRLFEQRNVIDPLDPGIGTTVVEYVDKPLNQLLYLVSNIVPDLSSFSDAEWLASGFDIPLDNLLVHSVATLGYVFPLFLIGLFVFRRREVAQ